MWFSNLWSFHLRASVFFGKKDTWSSTKKIENKEVSETYRKHIERCEMVILRDSRD